MKTFLATTFNLLPALLVLTSLQVLGWETQPVESAQRGPELAAQVVHTIEQPAQLVTGNGDISLMWNGPADHFDLAFGKADFWGVVRGNITTAGHLHLKCPELKGASYHLQQNIGPAILTGRFTAGSGAELTTESWIAYPQNLIVTELRNTGKTPLSFSSELINGLNSHSLPGDVVSSADTVAIRVSPDLVDYQLGNRSYSERQPDHKMKNVFAPFVGLLAGVEVNSADAKETSLQWNPVDPLLRNIGKLVITPDDLHGGSVQSTGEADHRLIMRGGVIPQHGFTFTAWVNPSQITPDGTVFAAVAREVTNHYPYFRGFLVHLVNGKPEARLNYYTATGISAVPINQWTKIKATYFNQKLILYVNGQQVAEGYNPPASAQMGWDKATLRTGDPALPFEGCAPVALLAERVDGVTAMVKDQELAFVLAPGQSAHLLVSLVSDRNTPGYESTALGLIRSNPEALTALRTAHDSWWHAFWSKSFVDLPNERVRDNWYASLYLLACCSRADVPPPGLFHNFITGMGAPWDGDYTLDYNYQAPFWAAYASNHFELADSYEPLLLDHIGRGESIAQNAWRMSSMDQPDSLEKYLAQRELTPPDPNPNLYHGIYLYTHLIPLPGWSNDFGTFWNQKSNALFCTVNMVQRWRLTRDLDYARKVYPFLKGTAEFWDNYLVLKDGRYESLNDAVCEGSGNNTNPSTTLSFIRLLYPSLIEISEKLHLDADLRPKWQDVLDKLSPFTIADATTVKSLAALKDNIASGKKVILNCEGDGPTFPRPAYPDYRDHKIRSSSAGMSCVQTIFPGWSFGIESPAEERAAALNTVTLAAQWYDFNNECNFYPAAAAAGYDPKEIFSNLQALLENYEQPDFTIKTGGGGTENDAIVPATLHNMFLQSYQTNIHLFPNWPKDQDATFGNLPACGGFLISSQQKQGTIRYVEITSQAGETCRIVNPWPQSQVKVVGSSNTIVSGSSLNLQTKAGATLLLTPAP